MRAIHSHPDWDPVVRMVQDVFWRGGPCEAGWSLHTHSFFICDAKGTPRIKLSPQDGHGMEIVILVAQDMNLVRSGSWLKQVDGSWQSQEWGRASNEEMLRHVEDFCRGVMGCVDS